jgi:NAD(P)-dependent dehydrogenase (short-subunit alcohol dehydrogenase family)
VASEQVSLEGEVVLVSGAAGGIGRHVVHRLLDGGARVCACDRPGAAWDEALLSASGASGEKRGAVTVFEADLAEASEAAAWVNEALRQFGRLDSLVNVAGYWQTRSFLEVTPKELDEMIEANLKTAFYPSQAAARHMVAQGEGSIVHFASTAGEYGSVSPGAHYAAAKGAVIALTRSMARELSPLGVRVNAISPGPVDTRALAGGGALDRAATATRTLLGRLGRPEEVAEVAAFLVGKGSSFITGQVIGVNGGSRL